MKNITYDTYNKRMLRVKGHLEATIRMVENNRNMYDILIQLSAVEGAIKSLHSSMLSEYTNEVLDKEEITKRKKISRINTCISQIFK